MTDLADVVDSPRASLARERRIGVALWTRLARVYGRNIRLTAGRLRAWDLSVAQFDALAQIGAHEGIIQQELAQRLLVTQGNMTQLLDKMELRGLIQRCRDGRLKRLVLTDEGRHLRDSVLPGQEQFQAEQFAALTTAEQRTMLALLGKLERAQRERSTPASAQDSCDEQPS